MVEEMRKKCRQCVYEKEPALCPDDCAVKAAVLEFLREGE